MLQVRQTIMRRSGDREVGSSYDLLTLCMRSDSGCDGTRPIICWTDV